MQDCPKCKAPTMQALAPEVFQCGVCSTRIAHGELMPRIVIKPYEKDSRLVVVTIFDQNVACGDGSAPPPEPVQVVVDRGLAKLWGSSLYSLGG
jgi:hypothetical protein